MTLSAFTPTRGTSSTPANSPRSGFRSRAATPRTATEGPGQGGQPRCVRLPHRRLLEHREVLRQERRLVRGAGTRVLHVPEGVHQGAPRGYVIMAEGQTAEPRTRDRVFQEPGWVRSCRPEARHPTTSQGPGNGGRQRAIRLTRETASHEGRLNDRRG